MAKILVASPLIVVEQVVPFTYESGTLVLQQVFAGDLIDTAWVVIKVAFDDPSSTIFMGTTFDPYLVFGIGDVTASIENQYTNQSITQFLATDFLQLIVNPAASTVGSGLLVYRYRR
jgi:hypothetical protein